MILPVSSKKFISDTLLWKYFPMWEGSISKAFLNWAQVQFLSNFAHCKLNLLELSSWHHFTLTLPLIKLVDAFFVYPKVALEFFFGYWRIAWKLALVLTHLKVFWWFRKDQINLDSFKPKNKQELLIFIRKPSKQDRSKLATFDFSFSLVWGFYTFYLRTSMGLLGTPWCRCAYCTYLVIEEGTKVFCQAMVQ